MRLWTIHPARVWEALQEEGKLLVDERHLPSFGYVPEQYRWLVNQLTCRIPGYPGSLPWWSYTKKPDLRSFRFLRPAGKEVRIELELDAGEFVVFPAWAWNQVLCQHYLSVVGGEYVKWEKRLRSVVPDEDLYPLPQPWQSELEKSWERLFEPTLPPSPVMGTWGTSDTVAVFGILRLGNVRQITPFRGMQRLNV